MIAIVTGASRGIGRAFVAALPSNITVYALARDEVALRALAEGRPNTVPLAVDLSSRASAARAGEELARTLEGPEPIMLVHNAGLWPSERTLVDGLERAFIVNCLSPIALQRPLLDHPRLARILVIGAGLMLKGRFDAERTPFGRDFSWFRTYASTKLAFAVALRHVARAHPNIDVAMVHPGLVRTDLGARSGLLGWLVNRVKERWMSPEACAEILLRLVRKDRWSSPGDAQWIVGETAEPWPEVVARAEPEVLRALAIHRTPGASAA